MASLVSLAKELLAKAEQLEHVLEHHQIPHPTLHHDTLEALPDDALHLRRDLLDATDSLRSLVQGARKAGLELAANWSDQVVLRLVWRYKLASAVPLEGSATYEEISQSSGLATSMVLRTIRAATALKIFDETSPGHVQHTAISRLLATNDGFYNLVGLQVEDIGPAGGELLDIWQRLGDDPADSEESAFSIANKGRSFFTMLAEEPSRAARFDAAMKYTAEDRAFSFADIVRGYDWSTLDTPGTRIVDLGGGYGQISQALAHHTQHLSFVVHDLPHVVAKARELLPPALGARISFEPHSFMDAQPTADPPAAFLISRCLHNWSDSHCAHILRALIPALQPGSKVLIWDALLGAGSFRQLSNRFDVQQDFIMAVVSNGKDRSLDEFRKVLTLADPRFSIEDVRRPTGTKLGMVVVAWNGI